MTPASEMPGRIRRYLLGQLSDDARQELEQQLLTDDEMFEELLVVEDEIVDDYLGDRLSAAERKQFETDFLVTPERRAKLRFGRAFDRYISSERPITMPGGTTIPRWAWMQSFATQSIRIAVFAILLIAIGIGVWRIFFHQTEVDKALVALNAAYREQRPVEARITQFDYAPYITTRGPGSERINEYDLRRAELTLLDALNKNPTPAVHHALGKVFLAKKDFDRAIEQFDEAIKGDPKNAQCFADLGAAWLEKGKLDVEKGRAEPGSSQGGKGMEELGRSFENLSQALTLNANLLEALFNRALCQEQMTLYTQAEDDWHEYLKRDSASSWAEEAKRKLQILEEHKQRKAQTKDLLLKSFVAAYETENDDAAWAALSVSRSRTGNLIVEALLDSYFSLWESNRAVEARKQLQQLYYAGKVEVSKVADRFTSDLARSYMRATPAQLKELRQARELMKSATNDYNKVEWKAAIEGFSGAAHLFSQGGSFPEQRFAEAWVGFCYLRIPDPQNSLRLFQRLSTQCEAKNYRSLLAQALLAQSDALSSRNQFSEVLNRANESLTVSQQIDDRANAVRCLQSRMSTHLILANYRESLANTLQALSLVEALPPDDKITWPFYYEACLDFYFLGMPTSALAFEKEALRVAIAANLPPLLASRSYDRLALIFEQLHNYDEALNNSELARREGQKINDIRARTNILAHSALSLGTLYRETGDPQRAIASLDKALALYKRLGLDIYQYETHKAKLLALMELNDDVSAEKELGQVLYWFEQDRDKIQEEMYRDRFFDVGQDTYDLAVDFAYSKRHDERKAYDYTETSRARSLWDLMTKGALIQGDDKSPQLKLLSVTSTLTNKQIQEALPDTVQLLEYSVLDDKTIIWLITRKELSAVQVDITRKTLSDKVEKYVTLLSQGSTTQEEVAHFSNELYAVLIRPVEPHLNRQLRLCIIPDGTLNFLPFASLVSSESHRYLIDDYILETSPSATVFIGSTKNANQKQLGGPEHLLIIGNPDFDRAQFGDLPDLPGATREAEEVAALYGTTPLIGDAAVGSRVRKVLNNFEVVHFATHAVPDESPLLTKLLLAKDRKGDYRSSLSYLRAADIYQMRLSRTRLVVLSACQTGIERSYRSEGAIGLARPFIAAGVPLVVASLWPVESEATAHLMISFHKHRKQDHVSTVEALRRAQLDALHGSHLDSRASYDWAAFVAIGGYADF